MIIVDDDFSESFMICDDCMIMFFFLKCMNSILMIKIRIQGFIWVCLKIGYIPNEIAIFHRDNDQQNQTGFRGTQHFQ